VFPIGITTVTYTATDASNNTHAESFTVTVNDTQNPVITSCPANITANTDLGICTKTFTTTQIGTPIATDNCSAAITWTRSDDAASLTTPYPFGTTTITWKATDPSGNFVTCTQNINISNVTTTTTVMVSPSSQQYSDQVTLTATVTNCGFAANGGIVTFIVTSSTGNTQTVGTAPVIAGVATLTIALLETDALSTTTPPAGVMAPGVKTVSAIFGGTATASASTSTATNNLTITKEDAGVYYTGSMFVSTSSTSASTASVLLSATVKDITAVSPLTDNKPGDIRNARVRFVNRDLTATAITSATSATGYYISDWLTPGLVNAADTKTGVVTANWTASIGNSDAQQFTLGVIVDYGYYTRNASDDDAVITVSKPLTDFVTGGGYIIMTDATGAANPGNGKRNNFGFNIKRTKNGVLQGNINTIIRTADNKVIQVKGNAMSSLSVSPALANSPAKAVFVGKANIQDITDPLNVISIAGNQTLQVSMTDRGEPGFADDISIIVYRDANVYFSSNWNGTSTQLQVLDGGNIKVHSTANYVTGTANSITTIASSLNPAFVGQAITFTATVSGAGSIKPTGLVTFVDVTKNVTLGSGTINTTTGVATIAVAGMSAGLHEITAFYGGDVRYVQSGASLDQTVNAALAFRSSILKSDDTKKAPELFLTTAVGPNPSATHFTLQVKTNSNEVIHVTVKDMLGRPVEILKLPADRTLDFGHRYYAGSYFVQVQQGKKTVVEKIIKL
jgi:hypothetical protein